MQLEQAGLPMDDDFSLLQRYVRERSDAAFQALMNRHVDLVYSASLRLTNDPHLAEDVTQAVFIVLSRKASQLKTGVVLPAWLLTVTRLTAANARRDKSNQSRIEQKAASMTTDIAPDAAAAAEWAQLSPLLDDALAALNEIERAAVVLRYFNHCSSLDIAKRLDISADAAEKRVSRGLEKLRSFFARKGVTVSAVILAGHITAQSVHAAPAALVSALPTALATATAAGAGKATSVVLAKGAMTAMTIATTKQIAVYTCALIVIGVTSGVAIKNLSGSSSAAAASSSAPLTKPITSEQTPTEPAAPPKTTDASAPPKESQPPAPGTGNVRGTVKFDGEPPEPKFYRIPNASHPDCKHNQVPTDDLIVDKETKGIKDAIIRVLDVKAPPPERPFAGVEMDQKDCRFSPHALVIPPGANLTVLNPDAMAHNVHTVPLDVINTPINKIITADQKQMVVQGSKYFAEPEMIKLQCDIHPWMNAWLVVHDPRFAYVTGKDGSFEIRNVPPGKYKVSVFHTLGEQIIDIEVKAGESVDMGKVQFKQK
jgi:RNA polymerase sigma factor (sigma-70 family)